VAGAARGKGRSCEGARKSEWRRGPPLGDGGEPGAAVSPPGVSTNAEPEQTRHRLEILNQSFRRMLLRNGGARIALLAFVQVASLFWPLQLIRRSPVLGYYFFKLANSGGATVGAARAGAGFIQKSPLLTARCQMP
jgi:hypothetical protein